MTSLSERLRPSDRLHRRREFQRCYREGKKRHGRLATLHVHASDRDDVDRMGSAGARLGITASRKVGKAVVRHRAKRRVREIFRRFAGRDGLGGLDLVVHLKPTAGTASFDALRAELEHQLASLTRSSRR